MKTPLTTKSKKGYSGTAKPNILQIIVIFVS